MTHFKSSFWSQKQPESTLPDFQTGFNVLHQKLTQSKIENEELVSFFKDRIALEESYATKLIDQSKVSYKTTGFGRDEGATLKVCFGKLKESTGNIGQKHRETATALGAQVLKPLQEFHEDYKRNVAHSKQAMESMFKQFDGLVKETERARYTYHKKCREKEMAVKLPESPSQMNEPVLSATSIQLGNKIMTPAELSELVCRMKKDITMRDYKVPILGTYKNTSTGEDISIWLQHNLPQCKDSPAMADVVGQQLIQPYNVLRLVGQRGSKFTASASCYYQWRSMTEEDNTDEVEKADEIYRAYVKKLDQMRMAIEEAMFAHFNEMEQLELKRINQIKERIASFIDCLSASQQQQELENMKAFQESLKPDQDIQYIIQQYTVSGFSPKAILYDSYYRDLGQDQVFGIPLEELGKESEDKVPRFIKTLLEVIQNGIEKAEDKDKVWSTPCPLDQVHAACLEINGPQDGLTVERLEKYEPALLVAVLRYYFLELPDCLMTFEMYDPISTILTGNKESRLASLSNLISTLPGTHFFTLKAIMDHLVKYKQTVSSTVIDTICQSLGPTILRAKTESYTTLHSNIPFDFMHTLFDHHSDLFSESTLKLHAESEKRRLAKPIIMPNEAKEENKKTFMSLITPIVDESKWSSVMGVFQRNPSISSPTVTEPKSSISLSFGSTTITQSPPQSPKVVMFDGGDIFDDKADASFFDDDEDT